MLKILFLINVKLNRNRFKDRSNSQIKKILTKKQAKLNTRFILLYHKIHKLFT